MGGSYDSSSPLVRLRHYQGQHLEAADLQDEYNNLARLRGLHVVALHDSWGIALGFELFFTTSDWVYIGPGIAYDCLGRELILSATKSVDLLMRGADRPPGTYELVLRYNANISHHQAQPTFTPRATEPVQPGQEEPLIFWRPAGETRLGLEIPLVAVTIDEHKNYVPPPDLSVRHYAKALARPHIASGVTTSEQRWSVWTPPTSTHILRIGLETTLDTSKAGFVGTPFYLAELQIDREKLLAQFQDRLSRISSSHELLPVAFTSIAEATATSFKFHLLIAANAIGEFIYSIFSHLELLPLLFLHISWVGIEPVAGCLPQPNW